jgi:hypothetical protein
MHRLIGPPLWNFIGIDKIASKRELLGYLRFPGNVQQAIEKAFEIIRSSVGRRRKSAFTPAGRTRVRRSSATPSC